MKIAPILIAMSIGLSSCSAPIVHRTESGRPETTVNAKAGEVHPALVSALLTGGFVMERSDQSLLVADREAITDFGTALLATPMDSRVFSRLTVSIIEIGSKTRLVADVVNVSNRGTAFERSSPAVPTARGVWAQRLLDAVARGFERGGQSKAIEMASEVAKEGRPRMTVFE